jgi:DNA-binding SARP family transcriptional activator
VIEYRLLGPLEVARDGESIPLGGRRRRSALAILLLDAGRVVPVERLADDLYAGDAPATAVTQVHRQISELRRLLPEARLETATPGYVLRVEPDEVDLRRFERLFEDGVERLEQGDASGAHVALRDALGLWRGPVLADLADEPFARSAIARLEELRLAALERRLEAELELGRAGDVVAELEQLAAANPLRERPVELLMLALYRSGRQAEALAAYRALRTLLADELGLEPGPGVKRLETAILQQDASLARSRTSDERPVVVGVGLGRTPSSTLAALAVDGDYDTILVQLVEAQADVTEAAVALRALREPRARTAAFVATDWAVDIVHFSRVHDATLVIVDVREQLTEALPTQLLESATADVALVFRGDNMVDGGIVYVPFGGGEHDWSALELAAAIGRAHGYELRLVGTGGAPSGRRDASRLLADASLALQRACGVVAVPVLAPPTADALLAVVEDGALVVAGIGSRPRPTVLDPVRNALVVRALSPVVLVHRGLRPALLAPSESRTRFTWSLQN